LSVALAGTKHLRMTKQQISANHPATYHVFIASTKTILRFQLKHFFQWYQPYFTGEKAEANKW
jgi:hypothetical protein